MERVLAVSHGETHRIYPFSVLAESPLVNDTLDQLPIAVFGRQGTLSVLDASRITESRRILSANAFDRRLAGRTLSFEVGADGVRDRETGSTWNLLGQAVAGPLRGRELRPLPGGVHFAFAWLVFRPDSQIYRGP